MAIATPAVQISIYAEGNDSTGVNAYGLQDNFLRDNAKWTGITSTEQVKSQAQAAQIMAKIFVGRNFFKIENQDAANFFWDSYLHNPTLYRALTCTLFGEPQRFSNMVNSAEVCPKWLIDDINATEDTPVMLGTALWLRRRMARVFWREALWKGFDNKRFSRFPNRLFDILCLPSGAPDILLEATEKMLNVGHYYDKVKFPKPKYNLEQVQQQLNKIKLSLFDIDSEDTEKIGTPFVYWACIAPVKQPTNTTNPILPILAFLGITKILKLW